MCKKARKRHNRLGVIAAMIIDKYAPIGVFDSGVGGLTVVRELMRNLPQENIVYFGDTARVPYGNKSKETVLRYSRQIIRFLETKNVKAIVVACNTASALAMDTIEKEINIPIIGVVIPGVHTALRTTRNNRIGVIATDSTIKSNLYQTLLRSNNSEITVFGKACPLFVPLVEEGWTKDRITYEIACRYLDDVLDKDIDTLIMGCTHYPLMRSLLKKVVGDDVTLVNPAYETSVALKKLLEDLNLQNPGDFVKEKKFQCGRYRFFASDAVERFNTFADTVLPCEVESAELVQIEDF